MNSALVAPDRARRLNSAVVRHHANALAAFQGGEEFGVVFARSSSEALGGAVTGADFSASFCAANAPGLVEGGTLVISGASYRVSSGVEPDASGWVTVDLIPA